MRGVGEIYIGWSEWGNERGGEIYIGWSEWGNERGGGNLHRLV